MNFIKILGASGSKTHLQGTTSFQINQNIVIDAGNIINSLENDAIHLEHVFITHSHIDHIVDLPFIIESFFEKRTKPLKIYALQETIDTIKNHIFNNLTWPDFSQINLLHSKEKAIVYCPIELNSTTIIDDISIRSIHANHIEGSCGFVISYNEHSCLISGDTYINDAIKEEIQTNDSLRSIFIECSFPNELAELAKISQHLTPELVYDMLKGTQNKSLHIYYYHLKSSFQDRIKEQLNEYDLLKGSTCLEEGDIINIQNGEIIKNLHAQNKFERIMEINLALSNELNKDKLFEMILTLTRELTQADGGTLYIMSPNKKALEFKVVQNDSLNIFMGGTKDELTWPDLPLYLDKKEKNMQMVAAVAVHEKKIIAIDDVYYEDSYNFEGTKKFDSNTGYRSKSMLVIPLINHEDDVIGVLQLINKQNYNKEIISFNLSDKRVIKALAAQAAMALTNTLLIGSLEEFIHAFITTIGHAIDAKSPHTRNHIEKVAQISTQLAKAIHEDNGMYKDVKYSKQDIKQIEIAAWMHDVGKISMPEYIIDKSTKLQAICDRIYMIEERFEILKRELRIDYLENKIDEATYETKLEQINSDQKFIANANKGEEFMSDEKLHRIHEIAQYTYTSKGIEKPILNENEILNLSIRKGTLNDDEKNLMNSHAQLSLEMLSQLPFPKKYNRVLNIAANHHEKLNGKGYPRGLDESELSLEDRIMALADIFEALTASDRPYKDGKKLSEVFKILSFMVKDKEIDENLVRFFHSHPILKDYTKKYLKEEQQDQSELHF